MKGKKISLLSRIILIICAVSVGLAAVNLIIHEAAENHVCYFKMDEKGDIVHAYKGRDDSKKNKMIRGEKILYEDYEIEMENDVDIPVEVVDLNDVTEEIVFEDKTLICIKSQTMNQYPTLFFTDRISVTRNSDDSLTYNIGGIFYFGGLSSMGSAGFTSVGCLYYEKNNNCIVISDEVDDKFDKIIDNSYLISGISVVAAIISLLLFIIALIIDSKRKIKVSVNSTQNGIAFYKKKKQILPDAVYLDKKCLLPLGYNPDKGFVCFAIENDNKAINLSVDKKYLSKYYKKNYEKENVLSIRGISLEKAVALDTVDYIPFSTQSAQNSGSDIEQ